jgi:hypothetical protein
LYFIRSNPTPQPVKPPYNAEPVTWDKFSIDDNLKVLDLDRQVVIQENFRQQRNAFFYDYLSSILDRPIKSGKTYSVLNSLAFVCNTNIDNEFHVIAQ